MAHQDFSTSDATSTVLHSDRITDFKVAEGDRLDVGALGTSNRIPLVYRGDANATFTATEGQNVSLAGADTGRFLEFWRIYDATAKQTKLFLDRNLNGVVDSTDGLIIFDGDVKLGAESFVDGTFTLKVGTSGDDSNTSPLLSNADDLAYGLSGNDTLSGLNGNDIIYGDAGNDTLSGDAGRDQLYGGSGNDTLNGGDHDDQLYADSNTAEADLNLKDLATAENILNGGSGNDQLYGSVGKDTLNGDGDDDTLYGGDNDDTLNGGTGNDTLYGDAGNDRLDGGTGNDSLNGGAGHDILLGYNGNDLFYTSAGADTLTGGDGSDTIIFDMSKYYDVVSGDGVDTWTDFHLANLSVDTEADKIDVSQLLRPNYSGDGSASSLADYIKVTQDGVNTIISVDADGSVTNYSSTQILSLNDIHTTLDELLKNQQLVF